MTKIGILGAKGRMGRAIAIAVSEAGATLSGGIDQDDTIDRSVENRAQQLGFACRAFDRVEVHGSLSARRAVERDSD